MKPIASFERQPFRAQRVWVALDLLLTCETIAEARDQTKLRLARSRNHGLARAGRVVRPVHTFDIASSRRRPVPGHAPGRPIRGIRDTGPVTMTPESRERRARVRGRLARTKSSQACRGASGAARLAVRGDGTGGQPDRMLRLHPHRRRPSRRPPRRPRRAGGRPARAPVRRVHGDGRPRHRGEGRPRSSSPATCSTPTSSRAARSSASPPSSARLVEAPIRTVIIPGTHDVYDRASIYRAYDLAALAGIDAGRRPRHGPDAGPPVGPPRRLRRRRPRPGLRDEARAAQPARRDLDVSRERPGRGDLAGRDGPRLARDPRPDRPRRGRHHAATRSPRAASTTSPSVTGTRPSRAGRRRRRTPTPARPEPVALDQDGAGKVAPRRARRRRPAAGPSRSTPRTVGRTRFEKLELDAADHRRPAGPGRAARRPGPTRTSSSTSGSTASARTSSTSTSTRSRARSRRPSSRSASATCRMPALTEGVLPVGRHDRRRVHPRTSRAGSPSSRRPAGADATRPPSSATSSGSAGCSSPATR